MEASTQEEARRKKAYMSGGVAAKRRNGVGSKENRSVVVPASKEQDLTLTESRHVLQEARGNTEDFAPRREIPRTPPRFKHPTTVRCDDPVVETSVEGGRVKISVTPSKDSENIPPDRLTPSSRKVQALCFTPRKSLARSPPPPKQSPDKGSSPPPSTSTMTQQPTSDDEPPHQLVSGRESPVQGAEPKSSVHYTPVPAPLAGGGVGMGLPDDLVCTAADLAFLQRMKNIRHHDQLQKQMVDVDKALRVTAEQKEQLQHKAEKISSDLHNMKQKYSTTLSNVSTLQSTVEPQNDPRSPLRSDEDVLADELSHTHLSHLRHVQKLMTVQLDKTDREIQREVATINRDKQELQTIRVKESLQVKELEKELENIQAEKTQWEVKVQRASETQQKMEKELEALHAQLELTAIQDTTCQSHDRSNDDVIAAEKRAEERLRRLVARCDLYVKRHHLLKQLRQQEQM